MKKTTKYTLGDELHIISGKEHVVFTDGSGWSCFLEKEYAKKLKSGNLPPELNSILLENRHIVSPVSTKKTVKDNPLVSIVMLQWNGNHHLEDFFSSIKSQTYTNIEIVIVDMGSNDGSIETINKYINEGDLNIKLIKKKGNIGFCKGNNVGVKHSNGEVLFLLNNDVKLDKNCINNALHAFETKKNVGAIFPKLIFFDRNGLINGLEAVWNENNMWTDHSIGKLDFQNQKDKKIFGSIFAGVFIKKDVFYHIGKFDNWFFSYAEDMDLSYRLNIMGYDNYSIPSSFLYHKYRSSSQDKVKPEFAVFHGVRNYTIMILQDYQLKSLIKYLPRFIKRFYLKPIYFALKAKNKRRAWTYIKIILSLAIYSPHILYMHLHINRKRKVSDIAVWDHTKRENYDVFFYDNKPVINSLNIASSTGKNYKYEIGSEEFQTY